MEGLSERIAIELDSGIELPVMGFFTTETKFE